MQKQHNPLHISTIVWERWPDTPELITWTNALQIGVTV